VADTSTSGKNWLTRKIGPVPVWLIAVALLAAWYWYEHYGPGATTAATTAATDTGEVDVDVTEPGTTTTSPAPFAGSRQVASGSQSLNQWAAAHSTTAGAVTGTTEAAYTAGKLDKANHTKFDQYLNKGTGHKMPRGLVFYSSGGGAATTSASPPPGTDVHAALPPSAPADPSAGTGGSTSGPAIAAAQHAHDAVTAGGPSRAARPRRAATPAAGTTRWRS
jgi:hypothetical protein